MPYNETPAQAELYYEMALDNFEEGNKGTACSHLSLARNIAVKNNMSDLIKKIDALRARLG